MRVARLHSGHRAVALYKTLTGALVVTGSLTTASTAAMAEPEERPQRAHIARDGAAAAFDIPVQLGQATQGQRYAIPPGPLSQALNRFADESGLQLVYDTGITEGLGTSGVFGTYTPDQALRRLLSGTGLTYRYATENTIALSRPQGGATGPVTLGPITVTGERTVRSLRETASSVKVFDAGAIEDRPGLNSTNDVMKRVPNVTSSGTTNLAPAVRGVDSTGPAQGADAFFAGTRPRLNMQVDGRPLSYNEVIFGDVSLWDVDQVEVLRGPQSTLQGRNAIAGTVVVKTKDPTYFFEAGGRGILGNLATRQGSAFVSGPILDNQVAFRLAVDHQERESYARFEPFNGVDPNEFETTTLRGKLLVEPKSVDGLSVLATVSHSDHIGPQVESIKRPFRDMVGSTSDMPVFNPTSTGGTLDVTWSASDNLALEATGSVTDLLTKRHAPAGGGNAEIDGTEIVAEPRVRFTGMDGRLEGLGGLYYFRASQDEFIDFPSPGTFDDHTMTIAAFGEAAYEIFHRVDLTVGARVEQEERRRTGGAGIFTIDLDETYSAFLPKLGFAWRATDAFTVGAVVSRGYNGGGAGFTYNPPFQNYTFDPEYVWTYETYARSELLDGKLTLTGNLFYSEYTDMQLPFDLNPNPNVWSYVIRNADKAVTYGAEFGARWLAARDLELFADIGLLKTEVTENPGSGIEGNEFAQAPNVTASFGGTYRHASGLEFSADARFSDAYFSSINNDTRGKTEPYFVLNSKIGYRITTKLVELNIFAFVNNILDSDLPVYIEPGASPAEDIATILQPRTVGVGVQMSF